MRALIERLRASLTSSIGDVAFGMEDGAVSIAGLVFGVAASTTSTQIVLLAGATGAIAGAVSMMAGTYLDVRSDRSRAAAMVASERRRVAADPQQALGRFAAQLRASGFDEADTAAMTAVFGRNLDALVDHVVAFELGAPRSRNDSPWSHAIWMFVSDLFAAGVPVVPFALFDIGTARIVSLVVTGGLMALLGIARGRIGHEPIWRTALQTMAIAGAAALAGVVIGRLVTQ